MNSSEKYKEIIEDKHTYWESDTTYAPTSPVIKLDKRKSLPVFSGVLTYFPDALLEVSKCSAAGQEQHNPDKPLAWDRSKSGSEYDSLTRHLLDSTKEDYDTDGTLHLAKVAWRALAGLQKHLEAKNK